MYSSYSTLQRKQLTKQVYTDTQSTYLLVYAPGRHQALEHALENQLHRKFRLVTELAPALTDSVEGVLLVSEDLECTSTALTYFAAALRTGADFVVCAARLAVGQRPAPAGIFELLTDRYGHCVAAVGPVPQKPRCLPRTAARRNLQLLRAGHPAGCSQPEL